MHRLPAEVEGGKALSSCFSSYWKQVSFPCKSSATFLAFVCFGMILLRIMAPKYSDKVLFRVPKDKKAIWCLMEKMHVLVSFRHELWCYFGVGESPPCVHVCSVAQSCPTL